MIVTTKGLAALALLSAFSATCILRDDLPGLLLGLALFGVGIGPHHWPNRFWSIRAWRRL